MSSNSNVLWFVRKNVVNSMECLNKALVVLDKVIDDRDIEINAKEDSLIFDEFFYITEDDLLEHFNLYSIVSFKFKEIYDIFYN